MLGARHTLRQYKRLAKDKNSIPASWPYTYCDPRAIQGSAGGIQIMLLGKSNLLTWVLHSNMYPQSMPLLPEGSCARRGGSPEPNMNKSHMKSMAAGAQTSVGLPSFVVQCEPSGIVARGLEPNTLHAALTFLWDEKYTLVSMFNGSNRF